MTHQIFTGDCRNVLREMESNSIQTCITSPPYFGLRDYGNAAQIGLEKTPQEYVAEMVNVFREVKRVLREDGTLWLNLGDNYNGSGKGGVFSDKSAKQATNQGANISRPMRVDSLAPKNLFGIPWRVAFALQDDGWILREDIIWNKKNPMPESVEDRCTRSHEYIFHLSKSARYYHDQEAIKEPAIYGPGGIDARPPGIVRDREYDYDSKQKDIPRPFYKDAKKFNGKHSDKQRGHSRRHAGFNDRWDAMDRQEQCSGMRNKRSVWTIATKPYPEAHFATFPPDLIEPCILAGAPEGGTVLDPFNGSGTTGEVSLKWKRKYIGIELNPDYVALTEKRLREIQIEMFVPSKPEIFAEAAE